MMPALSDRIGPGHLPRPPPPGAAQAPAAPAPPPGPPHAHPRARARRPAPGPAARRDLPRPGLAPRGVPHLAPVPGRHRRPGRLHHPDPEPLRPRPRRPRPYSRHQHLHACLLSPRSPPARPAPSRFAAPSSGPAPGGAWTGCCSSPGIPASPPPPRHSASGTPPSTTRSSCSNEPAAGRSSTAGPAPQAPRY